MIAENEQKKLLYIIFQQQVEGKELKIRRENTVKFKTFSSMAL